MYIYIHIYIYIHNYYPYIHTYIYIHMYIYIQLNIILCRTYPYDMHVFLFAHSSPGYVCLPPRTCPIEFELMINQRF